MRRGSKPGKAQSRISRSVTPASCAGKRVQGLRLERRLTEALEQQTATAEVLQVILRLPNARAARVQYDSPERGATVRRTLGSIKDPDKVTGA
jgi:hypothetical protein